LRWEAEIDLRHLKSSMDMDFLRTKSPDMVHKELAIYFLAYNLIRSLMTQAALRYGKDPLRLSFKGTLQHLNTFLPSWQRRGSKNGSNIMRCYSSSSPESSFQIDQAV